MMYADPQALHALLDKLAKSVTLYLNAQIKAGAQAVMIFDTGRRAHRARLSTVFALLHA